MKAMPRIIHVCRYGWSEDCVRLFEASTAKAYCGHRGYAVLAQGKLVNGVRTNACLQCAGPQKYRKDED